MNLGNLFITLMLVMIEINAQDFEQSYYFKNGSYYSLTSAKCAKSADGHICFVNSLSIYKDKKKCYFSANDWSTASDNFETYEVVFDASSGRYLIFSVNKYRKKKRMLKTVLSNDELKEMNTYTEKEGVVSYIHESKPLKEPLNCKGMELVDAVMLGKLMDSHSKREKKRVRKRRRAR